MIYDLVRISHIPQRRARRAGLLARASHRFRLRQLLRFDSRFAAPLSPTLTPFALFCLRSPLQPHNPGLQRLNHRPQSNILGLKLSNPIPVCTNGLPPIARTAADIPTIRAITPEQIHEELNRFMT